MTRTSRAAAVALICGVILSFAFPEPDIAPLAWIAIAPLILLLRDRRAMQGFGIGFAFGAGFFGSLIVWISIVGWISWGLLVILQSTFIGLFGAFVAAMSKRTRSGPAFVVVVAAAWVAAEFARANFPVVGFTWGELAQSQHNVPWLLRTASIAGSWGTAFVLVAVNALIASAVSTFREDRGRGVVALGVAALLLVAPLAIPANDATGEKAKVAIVQGNIPEHMEASFEKDGIIIGNHLRLTETLAGEDVDFVVWPESSVGIDMTTNPEVANAVASAANTADTEMIVGATLDAGDKYKVMALHIDNGGDIVDRYQKRHLVPFGEFVPWRGLIGGLSMLDQVPRDAIPGPAGDNVEPFDIGGGPASPIVSFEGDFGSLARERIANGGRLLVVATNTSTWERSWASAQHLAFSQVRAAENGTWVVHAALTGISGFVAPDGSVAQRSDLWEPKVLVQEVRFAEDITLYARWGDWLAWACVALVIGSLVLLRIRPRPNQVEDEA